MTLKSNLPNILIFLPDEMRADTVSLEGKINPIIKTPNIDKLTIDGAIFTSCFTASPFCVPSRCATFTGQYVHSGGHRSLYQMLEPYEENIFKLLKENGYEVYWMGRNDLFNPETIDISVSKHYSLYKNPKLIKAVLKSRKTNPYPFGHRLNKSFYFGKRDEESSRDLDFFIIQKALEYLDSSPPKPFCLYIALDFPHPPYTVEEPYFSMYNRKSLSLPISSKLDDKPEFMKIVFEAYGLNNLTEEDYKETIGTYYGMVTRVDNQFGKIIEKLKKLGMYEDTAIFFLSDHGDYVGNYGLMEKWPNALQDCLVKVPLLV
ncbi:MAG: sulfatase-like hydrolase/transferase [Candidatus Thorarchaeota archaeon]